MAALHSPELAMATSHNALPNAVAANTAATNAAAPAAAAPDTRSGGTWRMVAAMLLSGTIGLVVIESGLPVEQVVLLRCLLGALGLGAWLGWRRAWVRPSGRDWRFMLLGGVALVANWVALFHAYAYVGIAVATVVYHVQPFMLVLAAALGGEAIGWRKLPWMLLALAGVVLSSGMGTDGVAPATQHIGAPVWGVLLALAAAALYTVTVVSTRRVKGIAPAQIAMVQMLAGGAALALWSAPVLLQGLQRTNQVPLAQTVICVLIVGLVHTSLMYGLMYGAFQRLGAAPIAMLSFIYPAIALAVDLLWFGAHPTALQWQGMALSVLAVLGYRWQDLRAQARA